MKTPARRRGIALLTAILVVAVASLAATAVLGSSNLSIHRTAALRDSEQAWWIATGVESWVLGILQQDARDTQYDGLNEAWAQPVDYLPVEQGFVSGEVADLQGRFNLNNLQGSTAADAEKQFQRLLEQLPDVEIPPGLVASIRDWMDADDQPGFAGGAEDTVYLGLQPPYRAANQPFSSVSELRAVQGMTPALYRALTQCHADEERKRVESCIAALPQSATAINVNTAPPPVLLALSASADANKIAQFVEQRREKPYESVQEFIDAGIVGADAKRDHLSVRTGYFRIQGQIVVGSSRVALYSLIHRPSQTGKPIVLSHSADAD